MTGPLEGLRVIDCSRGTAGPRATGVLADYGADVLWIEPPGGARLRGEPAFPFLSRGKQSTVADLHTPEVKELYTDVGFLRSTDIKEAKKGGGQFPPIEDLFTVDEIGGWDALNEELFSDSGIVTQAIAG